MEWRCDVRLGWACCGTARVVHPVQAGRNVRAVPLDLAERLAAWFGAARNGSAVQGVVWFGMARLGVSEAASSRLISFAIMTPPFGCRLPPNSP